MSNSFSSKKIYWLKLKLELLPCLQKEIDKVCSDYMHFVEEARSASLHNQNLLTCI